MPVWFTGLDRTLPGPYAAVPLSMAALTLSYPHFLHTISEEEETLPALTAGLQRLFTAWACSLLVACSSDAASSFASPPPPLA